MEENYIYQEVEQNKLLGHDNFIVITGWMINDYNLSGNELLVYALIYGLSQYGKKNGFFGSITTMQKWTNIKSDRTIKDILIKLTEKKLIEKTPVKIKNVLTYVYTANKYSEENLKIENNTTKYSKLLNDYAENKSIEIKDLKKQLFIKDYIDIDTYEIIEKNKNNFKNEYPELYSVYLNYNNQQDTQVENTLVNNNETSTQVENTSLYKDRTIQNNTQVENTLVNNNETSTQVEFTREVGGNYLSPQVENTYNTTNNTTNNNTAAKLAAVETFPDKIKEYLEKLFSCTSLPFDESFYCELESLFSQEKFTEKESLDFIKWSVEETIKKPRENIFNYFYKTVTQKYFVTRYITQKVNEQTEKQTLHTEIIKIINCPVCQSQHDYNHSCPECGLPERCEQDQQEISNYKIRFNLTKPDRKKLDLELEKHEKDRPLTEGMMKFMLWKKNRDNIFLKYKSDEV